MKNGEDEFLWYMRRGMLVLCAVIFAWGVMFEPMLLVMLPILVFASVVAIGRIRRDARRRDGT